MKGYFLDSIKEDLNKLTKEELIEEVQRRRHESDFLKEKLKQTESFILDSPFNNDYSDVRPVGEPSRLQPENKLPRQEELQLSFVKDEPQPLLKAQQKPTQRLHNIFGQKPIQPSTPESPQTQLPLYQGHLPPPTTCKNKVFETPSYCPKMHLLHLFKNIGPSKCERCHENLSALRWGCLGCRYFECIRCKPYPRYHCPYNDLLRPTGSLNLVWTDKSCDVCSSGMKGNGMSCASCNYNLCLKCFQ